MYDFVIVGSGLFGSVCAHELTKAGFKCVVLEKRNHIGGNCYTENKEGINIHTYGPHIFHTSNEEVWAWINQFVEFNDFTYRPVANYKGEIYSLPFNMWTFSKIWNITHPEEAKQIIKKQSKKIKEPTNFEEQAIKLVGKDVYKKLIKGYTSKQWKKSPKDLPKEIIKRLPVRFDYDNNYFNDKYQGIPKGGYTQIFRKLLNNIELKLSVDYLAQKQYWDSVAKKVIYTGPIDAFYNYSHDELEYKTTKFVLEKRDFENFQGTAVMNYTDEKVPYTRCIEHKHFEKSEHKKTFITWEYPQEFKVGETEPYYPVNDNINNSKYEKYKELSKNEPKVIFGGRLAEYKYYDMHQVIESALNLSKELIKKQVKYTRENVYSQNGEDGIIKSLLSCIEPFKDYWCCEVGAWDGKHLSNTFNLVENYDYNAIYIEPDDEKFLDLLKTCEEHGKILPINKMVDSNKNLLDDILSVTSIPNNFDILSIDVDGIDYAIWESLKKYQPKIVIIEINSGLDPEILYSPEELTEDVLSRRTGVNFRSCYELAKNKNYSLICHIGNMIFIHNDYKGLVECFDDTNYKDAFDKSWIN